MATTYAIPNGRTVMDATTYTGNGGTQSIVNATGFKPDLVWTKSRSAATDNSLEDSVRGVLLSLVSNTTSAEASVSGSLTAFNSNGYSIGNNTPYNANGATFVGWQWQAGQGTTSTNTNGTITSTVSVNATAGFSIVTYTGLGSGGSGTVGHGLGAAPYLIISKSRNNTPNAAPNWPVYHISIGKDGGVCLNNTGATFSSSNYWGTTTPGSSTFGVVSGGDNNNGNMVAYCWTPIPGFSQFGSYTGNGSTNGPFVYCGFRPRFIMVKRAVVNSSPDQTNDYASWTMYDTARNTYNNMTPNDLYANKTVQEGYRGNGASTSNLTDMIIGAVSNGFYLSGPGTEVNANTGTYIYAAFAENPFKYANAR